MNKPSRRSRAETRDLVVGAALELVTAEGLGVEPTTISYQKVFEHLQRTRGIRITRASVHERLWSSQDEFQEEVLLRVSRMATGLDTAAAIAAGRLEETAGWASMSRVRELVRCAADAVLDVASDDPLFFSWVGITLSVANDSPPGDRTRELLAARTHDEYAVAEQRAAELLGALASATGVRPTHRLFPEQNAGYLFLARLGLTLAEGATIRTRFDKDELPDVRLNTGPNGEEQTWTAFAAGYWALLNTFLEPDPDAAQNSDSDASA